MKKYLVILSRGDEELDVTVWANDDYDAASTAALQYPDWMVDKVEEA